MINTSVYSAMRLLEVLSMNTNEDNMISREDILNKLYKEHKFEISKKTFLNYIDTFRELGFDIGEDTIDRKTCYSFLSPELEYHELKLIADCLSANKSITISKTENLRKKLYKLNNKCVADSVEKTSASKNMHKTKNEAVFINIDTVYKAIDKKHKISFKYYQYDENYNLVEKQNTYKGVPLELIIQNEYYYLIMHDDLGRIANYRMDKIKSVNIIENESVDIEKIKKDNDVANYTKKCFKMFGGSPEIQVSIRIVDSWAVGFIKDELGDGCRIFRNEKECFASFPAFMSEGLINWIMSMGKSVVVESPQSLRDAVKERIEDLNMLYKGEA